MLLLLLSLLLYYCYCYYEFLARNVACPVANVRTANRSRSFIVQRCDVRITKTMKNNRSVDKQSNSKSPESNATPARHYNDRQDAHLSPAINTRRHACPLSTRCPENRINISVVERTLTYLRTC